MTDYHFLGSVNMILYVGSALSLPRQFSSVRYLSPACVRLAIHFCISLAVSYNDQDFDDAIG